MLTYLAYFEQICQKVTGDENFGLPYWNWNKDQAMHPRFTDPASPLFHPRNATSVSGSSAFSDATLDTIIGDGNFFTFSNQLEGQPHNMTHVIVGADMVTGGSPLDPVFWVHHCMIDRMWWLWQQDNRLNAVPAPGWSGVWACSPSTPPATLRSSATVVLRCYQFQEPHKAKPQPSRRISMLGSIESSGSSGAPS